MSDQKQQPEGSGEITDPNDPVATTPKAKPIKHEPKPEAVEDDDDEDNVPLAFSRAHINKKLGNPPKVKKEEFGREDSDKPSKGKTPKKEGAASNGKLSRVKKEEAQDSDDDGEWTSKGKTQKKVAAKGNGRVTKVKKVARDSREDDDVRKARKNGGGTSSANASKTKKEEPHDSDENEEKSVKDKKKKKKKKAEEKKVTSKVGKEATKQGKDKKEKKVYDLPGQKHNPPEERDPLRIFYETLHKQMANSEMAALWMMEWGLLPPEEAKKVYEKKVKKSQLQKLGSPVKAASVKKTSSVSVKKVTKITSETVSKMLQKSPKKRLACGSESDNDDDDFIISKKIKKKVSR